VLKRIHRFLGVRAGARTIRARVLVVALIPCLALVAVGIGGAGYLVAQGKRANDFASKLRELIPSSIVVLDNLREERRLSLLALGGDTTAAGRLRQQRPRTDESVAENDRAAGAVMAVDPTVLANLMPTPAGFLDQLTQIRERVDTGSVSQLDVLDRYSRITNLMYSAMADLARTSPDSAAAVAEADSTYLGLAADEMSAANALAAGSLTDGGLNLDEWRRFRIDVDSYHSLLDSMIPRMPDALRETYNSITASDSWRRVTAAETVLIERGPRPSTSEPDTRPVAMDLAAWQDAGRQVSDALSRLWGQLHDYATTLIEDSGRAAFTNSLWAGGGIVVVTIVALLIAVRLANRLINRLTRLRVETLRLANDQLPEIIGHLRDGKPVDIETILTRLDFGNDEIGQVADAFTTAQRTATAAAVQEAKTRVGVNAVFLNIAHRNQVVVHRQLEVLNEAQRLRQDPDQLQLLSKLDHLATRSRRNAESLIILGGRRPGRQWRNPVPLTEIVRSAVAETEDYARVHTGRLPAVQLLGTVVGDLIHLLAELLDNATSFSPPISRVEIRGTMVGDGAVVEIEDEGLGIPGEERDRINARLRNPPDFGVMSLSGDARLGLFVVARLAARHGIVVTLAESGRGGARAIVFIRGPLIAPMEDGEHTGHTDGFTSGERPETAAHTPPQRQPGATADSAG
jgi:signal transduction histidine kinase